MSKLILIESNYFKQTILIHLKYYVINMQCFTNHEDQ